MKLIGLKTAGPLLRDPGMERPSAEVLLLSYCAPYDWESMLGYLATRAIPGVEAVEDGCYWRTVEVDGQTGTVAVANVAEQDCLGITIRLPEVKAYPAIVKRVRRVFDVSANVGVIAEHLSRDPLLAPLLARRPGLRVPGAWDGFELAVRAILGQQISVAAARGLAGQIVALHGDPVSPEYQGRPDLTHVFPSASRIASANVIGLRIPQSRTRSLQELAEAASTDPGLFEPRSTLEAALADLRSIRGVGEWTAQYIAIRALREMDAFPSSDLVLLRSLKRLQDGLPVSASDLLKRAEAWRPWRAYAAQHLWTAEATGIKRARCTSA